MMPAFATNPARDFWEQIFLSAIAAEWTPGRMAESATMADAALIEWHKRWDIPSSEQYHYAELSGLPRPDIQSLITAQDRVEMHKKQIEALRNLANQLPKELGEAYYSVAGEGAEQQLKDAEQWLSNIQSEMEKPDPKLGTYNPTFSAAEYPAYWRAAGVPSGQPLESETPSPTAQAQGSGTKTHAHSTKDPFQGPWFDEHRKAHPTPTVEPQESGTDEASSTTHARSNPEENAK